MTLFDHTSEVQCRKILGTDTSNRQEGKKPNGKNPNGLARIFWRRSIAQFEVLLLSGPNPRGLRGT